MKTIKLIICSVVFFSLFNFATAQNEENNQKKEFLILRVTHYTKRTGIESRMTVDIGTLEKHSLKNIIENGENGSIIFNMPDIKIVARNEVDFLTIIQTFGFELISLNEIELSGRNYFQYLFFKKTD
jgi:pyruvate formate-lyase activating enzyme-like uncharacterized protein